MKRSRFNEEQIIARLKEHEAGKPTADVCPPERSPRPGTSAARFFARPNGAYNNVHFFDPKAGARRCWGSQNNICCRRG